jgi:hypothetical protein
MSYTEQWKKLEAELKALPRFGKGYVRDGIVSLADWRNQKIRPLFIGKESHGGDGANKKPDDAFYWSITEHTLFGAGEKAKTVGTKLEKALRPSWAKTSYISYALQHDCAPYSRIHPIRHTRAITQALHNIAFINVGKQVGDKTTSPSRLVELYKRNGDFLHQQISICQPNVIIGWNTLGLFEQDPKFLTCFSGRKSKTHLFDGIRNWLIDGKLFIAAGHPAARISSKKYVDSIVSIVRNHRDVLDTRLPSWQNINENNEHM